VNKTIWSSTLISLGLYALIGYFGAATFRFHSDETLLDLLNDRLTMSTAESPLLQCFIRLPQVGG
jgi:hypothetical protein